MSKIKRMKNDIDNNKGINTLSIVIVNYNTRSYLANYLMRLTDSIPAGAMVDVWVVDSCSRDESVKMVRENFPEVGLIENRVNVGYAKAANQGIKACSGKYVVVSNTDIYILGNALEKLMEYLDAHPDTGIVGPKVYDNPGKTSVQSSCRSFPSIQTALFNRYSLLTKLFPRNPWSKRYLMSNWNHDEPMEVDWVSGCFFIARRDALENVNSFDEDFFMYNEDVDLCYRIKKAGWKVAYCSYAEIAHKIGASRINSRAVRERHRGMWLFYSKHYAKNRLLDLPIKLGILIRMSFSLLNTRTPS